jgi:hypothetical protein
MRKICTLRSVGAGTGERPGRPVVPASGNPYRDRQPIRISAIQKRESHHKERGFEWGHSWKHVGRRRIGQLD